jgi:hypothetical protein
MNNNMGILMYIVLGLAIAFSIYWNIKVKLPCIMVISLGMIVGILLVIFQIKNLFTPGLYTYLFFTLLAFGYGVLRTGVDLWPRIIIILMSLSIFTYWIWVMNHWHGNTLLLPILTLVAAVVGIITKAKLRKELAFLVILAADAISLLIESWVKAL